MEHENRLAIITTHPIQYYAPLFKILTERENVQIKVFYTWGEKARSRLFDPGFGKVREWDIPLLHGYEFEFVKNISTQPGSHHFWGINNPGLINKINEWNATAILVIGWNFISHLKVMYHFKGKIPVLFRGDSTLLNEQQGFSFKKLLRRLILSFVYHNIDYALYVGVNNKAYFSASGLSEKQLIFVPHAIDNDRFSSNEINYETEALKWKEELRIPSNKPAVLFAGKLDTNKNVLLLVEAAKKFTDIHFIIVGDGELGGLIKDEIKTLQNITLLPFQNQSKMPVVYRLADVFVLLSKSETWGLAINEAMASGRMIVASNKCGGAIDLIKEGGNGFAIKPDMESFSKVLSWILQSPNQIAEFKRYSKELIKQFSLEKLSIAIENLIFSTNKINLLHILDEIPTQTGNA